MTLIEMLVVLVFSGLVVTTIGTRVAPLITRSGAGQAASTLALDLEQAVTLAARQRKPVRVTCDCANLAYLITDRATGNLLFRRALGGTAGYGVTALTFSTSSVDVYPSGLASAALRISISAGGLTRHVTMSTAGFVRVVR